MKESDKHNENKRNKNKCARNIQIRTNKYIDNVPNKLTITGMREKGTEKYATAMNAMRMQDLEAILWGYSADWRRAYIKTQDKTDKSQY